MFERLVKIICNYVEVEPENIHPESCKQQSGTQKSRHSLK